LIKPDEIVLSSKLIQRVFGYGYALPTVPAIREQEERALKAAMAEIVNRPSPAGNGFDPDGLAVIPFVLRAQSWRVMCGALDWTVRQDGRVARAQRSAFAIMRVLFDPINTHLVDLRTRQVPRKTWAVVELAAWLAVTTTTLETLVTKTKSDTHAPRRPGLVDYLLMAKSFDAALDRLVAFPLHPTAREMFRWMAEDSFRTSEDAKAQFGLSRQAYSYIVRAAFHRTGIVIPGNLKPIIRWPSVYFWRGLLYDDPQDRWQRSYEKECVVFLKCTELVRSKFQ
jgi:hypothetical protein